MAEQENNVACFALLGGICLLSGIGMGTYRTASSSGRKFKKQAAIEARKIQAEKIKEAQELEKQRVTKFEALVRAARGETKDLVDRVDMIERKQPVLKRSTGPFDLALLQDSKVPLAEVIQRTYAQRLALAGQGRKVEVTKLATGFQVTVELDDMLTTKLIDGLRLGVADLISHTPKGWIADLRIKGPSSGAQVISLGPLANLSPVAVGDAVEGICGDSVGMPAIAKAKGPQTQFAITRSRYPGSVHWFGPQEKQGSGTKQALNTKNATVPLLPGTYLMTSNQGGVVFAKMVTVEAKTSYRLNLGALKIPRGRKASMAGIVVPPRTTRYRSRRVVPPTRYRSRRVVPTRRATPRTRYRSRRPTPTRRPTPPGRYRSR